MICLGFKKAEHSCFSRFVVGPGLNLVEINLLSSTILVLGLM